MSKFCCPNFLLNKYLASLSVSGVSPVIINRVSYSFCFYRYIDYKNNKLQSKLIKKLSTYILVHLSFYALLELTLLIFLIVSLSLYLILIMFYTSLVDEQIVTISILIILELALIAV